MVVVCGFLTGGFRRRCRRCRRRRWCARLNESTMTESDNGDHDDTELSLSLLSPMKPQPSSEGRKARSNGVIYLNRIQTGQPQKI